MSTIRPNAEIATLINVFTVHPEKQDELVKLLEQATAETMARVPGFISANIHRSLDGTRVVNYAQWASEKQFKEMLQNPKAQSHMKQAAALADGVEPKFYAVSSVHEV